MRNINDLFVSVWTHKTIDEDGEKIVHTLNIDKDEPIEFDLESMEKFLSKIKRMVNN